MKPELQLSKLDAAKRQLETALALYFNRADPVSVHTLAAAAYNVLSALNAKRGGSPMMKDLTGLLDTAEAKAVQRSLNEAENFFKHADRDSDGLLKFNPQYSEVLLLEACEKYMQLTGEHVPLMAAFKAWFIVNHPNAFRLPPEYEHVLESVVNNDAAKDRGLFFATVVPMLSKLQGL